MGHSVREHLERLDTAYLKALLYSYLDGTLDVTADTVLIVLEILAEREPTETAKVHAAWERFCRDYMDEK